MATLLYVESSPRKRRSASIEVAQAFLAAYRRLHPGDTIDTLDVWTTPMPEFDGSTLDAKYAGLTGVERTPEQAAAWARLGALAGRFRAADKLLFSIPMWNFAIPYKLKHLIDVVSQKDLLFTFDERGLNGLLGGKKALAILARGVEPAPDWDHQRGYMDLWFKMVGVTDVANIFVEKTLYGPDVDGASRAAAKAEAEALAARF
ncbi:MAG: NAD(P)H-dependent oxidoreductase [Gammaproteobacteria bacterium]|nr:NAD(P)H-dependent oxidoreductase [Gammaproteobacteria bacterium]MBI5615671.1 NAD(P)H-dependent oxidoreductase [Gammaproteobacteria bacterium]